MIPKLLAIEMEGGACAQVASQENIDWVVLRVISDNADEDAEDDFKEFLFQYKNYLSKEYHVPFPLSDQ